MGWNSWDSFGTGVTEAEVKANAEYIARYMANTGWQYIVVDIQWSEPNPKTHGYRPGAELTMRDLWTKKDLGNVREGQRFKLAPHASTFYKLAPAR
jgi:uncharacterized protein (UPF0128 family)